MVDGILAGMMAGSAGVTVFVVFRNLYSPVPPGPAPFMGGVIVFAVCAIALIARFAVGQ
jgi:hypothetical protein